MWMEELRRALARLQMTINTTDEAVAHLDLPWYGRLPISSQSSQGSQSYRRQNYADPAYWEAYWEAYFSTHGYFTDREEEVICNFENIWPQLETFIAEKEGSSNRLEIDSISHQTVLVLGCGLSSTPVLLYEKGFKHITCVDISPHVVSNLAERFKKFPGIEIIECDARKLDRFSSASFDIIVDKGMIDVLYSGWNGFKDVDSVNECVCRILKKDGCFISVCCAPPPLRLQHFLESSRATTENKFYSWDVRISKGPEGMDGAGPSFVYIMTRLSDCNSTEQIDAKGRKMSTSSNMVVGGRASVDVGGGCSEDDSKCSLMSGLADEAKAEHQEKNKQGPKQLRQKAYIKGDARGGYVNLAFVRDPTILEARSQSQTLPSRPREPTMEENLANGRTIEEAVATQRSRQQHLQKEDNGRVLVASEVGFAIKADRLRRGFEDNAALKGGDTAGKGFKSELFIAMKVEQERLRERAFSLEPVKELARETIRQLSEKNSPRGMEGNVNTIIADLVRGQAELARLRAERPPQALEPRGDAAPVRNLDYELNERFRQDAELRSRRAKLGLDENDLSRPPEKWTPAMLSYVEFSSYGPPPPEEEKWKPLDDRNFLENLCTELVTDVACQKQLQLWKDGSDKIFKFFLARAVDATEGKSPIGVLKESLEKALGAFRPIVSSSERKRRQRSRRKGSRGNSWESTIDDQPGHDHGMTKEVVGKRNQTGTTLKTSKAKNRMTTLRMMDEKLERMGHRIGAVEGADEDEWE